MLSTLTIFHIAWKYKNHKSTRVKIARITRAISGWNCTEESHVRDDQSWWGRHVPAWVDLLVWNAWRARECDAFIGRWKGMRGPAYPVTALQGNGFKINKEKGKERKLVQFLRETYPIRKMKMIKKKVWQWTSDPIHYSSSFLFTSTWHVAFKNFEGWDPIPINNFHSNFGQILILVMKNVTYEKKLVHKSKRRPTN